MATTLGSAAVFGLFFGMTALAEPGFGAASTCVEGSYALEMAQDRAGLVVHYFDMSVSSDEGRAKDCRLDLTLDVPEGWALAIDSVEMSGAASLQGVADAARIEVDYAVGVMPREVGVMARTLRGPYEGDFTLPGYARRDLLAWTPCNGQRDQRVAVTTRVAVEPTRRDQGRAASLRGRGSDEALVQELRFAWRRCR